ncbi:putative disease resistance protein At3g14460 [Carica papaya]|uniref:putative disease resistance protein At3g14460 n=1 Tax=Carica papaya TaxID=3649 RepID=UPI000B8CC355|nr:putative disease resistance protein At3g14460 [Carica papaya]XP_021894962.1 putative disease resistance protein At3g14460 [Carica papaya]XP_021894963.1 putative disease resistance protein At3g14460 [Carica papaya]XP_021894964.1 putative disease resistance protein At3g14460 [Carica papaya]
MTHRAKLSQFLVASAELSGSQMKTGNMDDAFLFTSFEVMLERINACGELLEVFKGPKLSALLKRLKKPLLTIKPVLNDAEHKEDLDTAVKHWLNDLKDAFYQAEDVLDEIYTEALQRKLEAEEGGIMTRVRSWKLLASPTSLNKTIEYKIKTIVQRLEGLIKHIDPIGLREYSNRRSFHRPQVSPALADHTRIFGRDEDKQTLLNLLLSDDVIAGKGCCVIPIVGMAGAGKTALAHLLYNDDMINENFELKIWVTIGENFDISSLMKAVLRELKSPASEMEDQRSLQVELKINLAEKKFLLILDDVWSEKSSDWKSFWAPLEAGARGSKTVITTRSCVVASIMEQTVKRYELKLLAEEDCWEVFSKFAFESRGPSSYLEMEAIGRKIVKRCQGLPLAAKVVALHLRSKPLVEEWHAVLKNFPCHISEILPILKLSYDFLPSHLKRCFAYCSIFPKGYEFEIEKLVLLWMAEDLLQQTKGNKRFEDIGNEYFHYLQSRSFFLQSSNNKSCFVMHDLMNDLAKSVAGQFCFRLEDDETSQIPGITRHLSFSRSDCDAEKISESIHEAKYLRTILPYELPNDLENSQLTSKVLRGLLLTLQSLRVLCLSHYNLNKLSESIGILKHLRYLDVSNTAIKKLPDSFCSLHNLQTLLLSNCGSLTELPTNMGKLINLHYLDLVGTSLKEMPVGMSRLRSLQMLSNFVVGRLSGAGIEELKELLYLHRTLRISELQNVVLAREAKDASLKRKEYLEGLVLKWRDRDHTFSGIQSFTCDQGEVLEMLEPHPNLKSLSIRFYGGTRFPDWLGDSSFSNMVFLCLSNCSFCLSLPPLGELPSLKDLIIERLDRVQRVGPEFYGIKIPLIKPFRSLQTLKFDSMLTWEEWVSPEVRGGPFPCLRELSIKRCPRLVRDLPKDLPPLARVNVFDCQQLNAMVPRLPSDISEREKQELGNKFEDPLSVDEELQLHESTQISISSDEVKTWKTSQSHYDKREHPIRDDVILDQLPKLSVMGALQIHDDAKFHFKAEDEVSPQGLRHEKEITSIRSSLQDISAFERIKLSSSRSGSLQDISTFERDEETAQDISPFKRVKVSEVSQLFELQAGLFSLKIEGCDALKYLPEELMDRNPRLQELFIINCSNLKVFPRRHPPTLKTLYIRDCRKLEFVQSLVTIHQDSNLEYLCLGSSCDTLRSFPLGFFWKLKSLSIWDCENFSGIDIPVGHDKDHISLEVLEIRCCPMLESFPEGGLAAPKLRTVLIFNCNNLKALPKQFNKLSSLQSLVINGCPEILAVPDGGLPSDISTLCIINCYKLTQELAWGLQNLENLHCLELEGEYIKVESFPEEKLLPRNLYSLRISKFLKLKVLHYKGLKHLKSLETLEISSCNQLIGLPNEGLPSSLSFLCVNDCSLLKAAIQKKGKDWYKIAQIRHVLIDNEELHEII